MKKLFLIGAAALIAACSAQPETGYTVNVTANGDLSQLSNDTLVLTGGTRQNPVKDTVVMVNGKCTIKGETNTPTFYTLAFKGEKKAFARFFLENTKFDVTFDVADPENAIVTGGDIQTMVSQMNAKSEELRKANNLDSLSKAYRNASEEEKEQIMAIFDKVEEEVSAIEKAYTSVNPVSPYGLYLLGQEISGMPYAELEAALAAYDTIPAYAENVMLKEYKEVAELVKSLQPGNQAPDFVQNDPDGKPIRFSDIYSKNKLTMVDFWASWCGPCRAFNPELVKIYKKFHKKGFEILGVSHDSKHEAWVKGIKDDKLDWPQVSDLKYWDNEVGRMYYVRFIPQNIFVDQTGKIVGRQIDKPEVEKFINDFLSK